MNNTLKFNKTSLNYPAKMIAVVRDPMDFYDLRELNKKSAI